MSGAATSRRAGCYMNLNVQNGRGDEMKFLETGRYRIYFRIPFFKYFIAKDMSYNVFCFMYKEWDEDWGQYRWKQA